MSPSRPAPEAVALPQLMAFSDDAPVTRKIVETDQTILTLVCLKPGQSIPPFTHRRREAFVHCLRGAVRISPDPGPAELAAGDLAHYDGSRPVGPSNPGPEDAAFLVALIRKRSD